MMFAPPNAAEALPRATRVLRATILMAPPLMSALVSRWSAPQSIATKFVADGSATSPFSAAIAAMRARARATSARIWASQS